VLDKVEQVSSNTKWFRFKLDDDDAVSGLPVASALLTKYKGPEMEKPVIRPYTPISDEDAPGYLDFVVKKYPNGPMSEHLHSMNPGQRLDFKGPIPKYPWSANKHDHIALIAGGTGITPMWQVARAIFKNPEDKTKVTLVFGNVSEEDILLKREWEDLEQQYPQRFRAFYVLEKPPESWQQVCCPNPPKSTPLTHRRARATSPKTSSRPSFLVPKTAMSRSSCAVHRACTRPSQVRRRAQQSKASWMAF
jgi:cytochrome-b5 reductase